MLLADAAVQFTVFVPEAPDAEIVISFPTLDNDTLEPAVIEHVLKSVAPDVEATSVVPVPALANV